MDLLNSLEDLTDFVHSAKFIYYEGMTFEKQEVLPQDKKKIKVGGVLPLKLMDKYAIATEQNLSLNLPLTNVNMFTTICT